MDVAHNPRNKHLADAVFYADSLCQDTSARQLTGFRAKQAYVHGLWRNTMTVIGKVREAAERGCALEEKHRPVLRGFRGW